MRIAIGFIFAIVLGLGCAQSSFQPDRTRKSNAPNESAKTRHAIDVLPPAVRSEPFWWGISTSSYQTEDPGPPTVANFKTDWDLHFENGKLRDARGNGAWSYTCVDRDIAALKALGATHYRFSVEWARVEPKPGEFNAIAIQHYVTVARKLRAAGITPVVTLWHFTFPDWLAGDEPENHGWMHPNVRERWEAYVRRIVPALAKDVQTLAPMNEPNAYALASLINQFPPGGTPRYGRYLRMLDREAELFRTAAGIIREVRGDARIISVQNIIHWKPDPLDPFRFWHGKGQEYNYYHLDKIADVCDWIGFNYYFSEIASPFALSFQSMRSGEGVSDMGWTIDPTGLEMEIAALAERYGRPLVIMENGIADRHDEKRPAYLLEHVLAVRRAIAAGHDVRGYFHWSLMDNYEWTHGYEQKFGLYAVDRADQSLVPKMSADVYRSLATEGSMTEPLQRIPREPHGL